MITYEADNYIGGYGHTSVVVMKGYVKMTSMFEVEDVCGEGMRSYVFYNYLWTKQFMTYLRIIIVALIQRCYNVIGKKYSSYKSIRLL